MLGTVGGVYSSVFQLVSMLLFFMTERIFFGSMIHKIYSVDKGTGGVIANDEKRRYGPFGESFVSGGKSTETTLK